MTLRISKKYWNNEELKKRLGIVEGYVFCEIDLQNYLFSDISRFRKFIHTIVDYELPQNDNKDLHNMISNNDFTLAILLGIVEATNHNVKGIMNEEV